MQNYLELIDDILWNGVEKDDRTNTGTKSVFGRMLRWNLNDGAAFPLMTTKRVYWKGVVAELLWFLNGDTNIKYLQDNDVHIWDEWADENGDLGPVYGKQWRDFDGSGVDQIANVINTIKTNPSDRRMIVNAWNPKVLPESGKSFSENVANGKCALPPCHYSFQFIVEGDQLSLLFNMRSNDVFLGLPFNIASYALLLMMVARVTGMKANELVYSGGDVHIYKNHMEQIEEQLSREPTQLPVLLLDEKENITDFTLEEILDGLKFYNPQPAIKAPVAV